MGLVSANETVVPTDFTSTPLSALPSEFTWTVAVRNAGAGDTVGLNFFGKPTTGNAFDDYWVNMSGWQLQTNNAVPGQNVFGAEVVVPEPSALVLALFGGLGFLVMARRIRK